MLSRSPETQTRVLSTLSTLELVSVAQGPWRHESVATSPDLSDALAAIDFLAARAPTDRENADALLLVVKSTQWWTTEERALEQCIALASVDQLQDLARWFYDYFWSPGEYGGGTVTPWRLKRVVDRLHELGVPLASAVPDVATERLRALVEVGREYRAEPQPQSMRDTAHDR